MADVYQSSLFEPSAPPESLLHIRTKKKELKVVSGLDGNAKRKSEKSEKTQQGDTPSRPPFLDYFTKRRKISNNNNNNNNINNNSKCEHSSKGRETRGGGGRRFSFFRGKQTTQPSPESESTEVTTVSEKEETTLSQSPDGDAKLGDVKPQARDDMEVVVCHGLMKTESVGQTCLLSQPESGLETDSDLELGVQKITDQEFGVSLVAVGKNSGQMPSSDKLMDVSEIQEQLNSINLKRCKDATMPPSLITNTLPAHSESLSIPPVIEEMEENSVEEPPVIEIFLPQREPKVKQSGIELVQGVDGNLGTPKNQGTHNNRLGTHNNVKKRRKLRHILQHFLSMNSAAAKEDKQRLVEDEEEDDDEEEEQTIVETAIDGQNSEGDKNLPSKTLLSQENTDTVAPEKKRQPGTKGPWRGWGRRVRRSLGRGCHYLGFSVLNITNYIIAEATFMGPVYPPRNYDWEYIYNTNEYGVNEYCSYI